MLAPTAILASRVVNKLLISVDNSPVDVHNYTYSHATKLRNVICCVLIVSRARECDYALLAAQRIILRLIDDANIQPHTRPCQELSVYIFGIFILGAVFKKNITPAKLGRGDTLSL